MTDHRQQAIEAATAALGRVDWGAHPSVAATEAVDAALPHLQAEPIGYIGLYDVDGPFVVTQRIRSADDLPRADRVVALVPVEEP